MTKRIIESECFSCKHSVNWTLVLHRWEFECRQFHSEVSYYKCPGFQPYVRSRIVEVKK